MINRESKRLLHCKKVEEGRKKKKRKKKLAVTKHCSCHLLPEASTWLLPPRAQDSDLPLSKHSAYSNSVHKDLSTGRSINMQEVINLTIKKETNRTPLASPLKTNTGLSYSLRHKTVQDPTPKNRGFHSKSQHCIFPGKMHRCFLARGCPQIKTQSEQQTNIRSFSGVRAAFSYLCSPPLGEQHLAMGCNQHHPAIVWSGVRDDQVWNEIVPGGGKYFCVELIQTQELKSSRQVQLCVSGEGHSQASPNSSRMLVDTDSYCPF